MAVTRCALRAMAVAFVLHVAYASLAGSLESTAVSSLIKQAIVHAQDGPSDGSATAATAAAAVDPGSPQEIKDMAGSAKQYLDHVFIDQPEALQKVQQAWESESEQGFNAPSMRPADQPGPGGRAASARSAISTATSNSSSSSSSSTTDGSSSKPGSCQICEDLNMLYEADHPHFTSRMEELVVSRGYPLERHAVVTPDGYELVMFRIPHGAKRNTLPGKRPVVLLHHGITLSSDSFVLYGPDESLGFILADAGFDVWMANPRGNTYSRRNVNGLFPYQPQFWYFSVDTLAQLDLPTQVDYVLQTTGASKIAFLGHSQGSALVNLLCASKPEYNDKFSVLAQMAPVFFAQYMQQPVMRLSATLHADEVLYLLGMGEFLPNRLTAPLLGTLCTGWPLDEVCAAAISFFFFGPSQHIRAQDYTEIARTWPSSVGARNMVHWSQNLRAADKEFRYYDFGNSCNMTSPGLWARLIPGTAFRESCNRLQYGTLRPPAYDVSRVTPPTVYFLGTNDVMSQPEDVAEQQRRIGTANTGQFVYPGYGHMDFIWDRGMVAAPDIIKTIWKYSANVYPGSLQPQVVATGK